MDSHDQPSGSVVRLSRPDDDPLIALLLDEPGLLDAVLSLHIDDGSDHCRTCGGQQSGRYRFPCDMRLAAIRAAGLRLDRSSS